MRGESSNQNLNAAEKPKSNMLTWLLAGGCGCFALLSCVICGGGGTWWYVQKSSASTMEGVWEYSRGRVKANPNIRGVKLVVGNQLVATVYDRNTKKMVMLNGATFTREGASYMENIEFCSPGMQEVLLGKQQSFTIRLSGDTIDVNGTLSNGNPIDEAWKRIAAPTGEPHEGAWESVRATLDPNWREIKLITGDQFVHVIYDRKRKTTLGVGGGSLTLKDKKLVETSEYFEGGPTAVLLRPGTYEMRMEGDEMSLTRVEMPDGQRVANTWKRIKQ